MITWLCEHCHNIYPYTKKSVCVFYISESSFLSIFVTYSVNDQYYCFSNMNRQILNASSRSIVLLVWTHQYYIVLDLVVHNVAYLNMHTSTCETLSFLRFPMSMVHITKVLSLINLNMDFLKFQSFPQGKKYYILPWQTVVSYGKLWYWK